MAQLLFKTEDGLEKSISLLSEPGFTAKVVSIYTSSDDVKKNLWMRLQMEMAQSNANEIIREGCHALYDLHEEDLNRSYQVFCIIQEKKEIADRQLEQIPWVRDAFLVHRSKRQWIAVAEGDTHLSINQKPVTVIRILQDGMNINLGGLELCFRDIQAISVDKSVIQKLGLSRKCPFCHGTFTLGDVIILCPSCGTAHHTECWEAYGGRCSGPTGCQYGLQKSEITP